ncbi:MAG: HEAT repeat domain-containing protein [Planctomycetia bacterium]|nr:HEAT repeat domain-containing protein [Planctomycetia bacterium]
MAERLTLLQSVEIIRRRQPAEVTAEEIAAIRERLQASPIAFSTVGGAETVERFLAEAETSLATTKANPPIVDRQPNAEPTASPPQEPRQFRRKAEIAIFALLLAAAAGWAYIVLRPADPATTAKTDHPKPPAVTTLVPAPGTTSKKKPPPANESDPQPPTAPPTKDKDVDAKTAKPPEPVLWLGWQLHPGNDTTTEQRNEWDLTNPSNPVPLKGLFASHGELRLTLSAAVGPADRWLMVHVRPGNAVSHAGQIVVTIDGQQAANVPIGIGEAEWPLYVPLKDSHGVKQQFEVAFIPGEAKQEIIWWGVRFVADKSKKPDPESSLTAALRSADQGARVQAIAAAGQLIDPFDTPALVRALSDPNREVRKAAIIALARFNSVEPSNEVDALVKILNDRDVELRQLAAQSLMSFDTDTTWNTLSRAMVGHPDTALRLRIAKQLAGHAHPAIVAAYDKLLTSADDGLRLLAVDGVANMPDPGAIALLERTLADLEPGVRRSAATALSKRQEPAAEVALIAALKNHSDLLIRRIAMTRFAAIPSPQALPAIRVAIASQDDLLRRSAPQALVRLAGDDADALLLQMSHSQEANERDMAGALLWNRPGKVAEDVMLANLASSREPWMRQLSWQRFRMPKFITPRVIPALREALKDPSAVVRFDVVELVRAVRLAKIQQGIEQGLTPAQALDALSSPPWSETFDMMVQMADDPVPRVRAAAAGVLRGDPHPAANAAMMRLMQSPDVLVRQLAAGRFPRYAPTSIKMMELHKLCLKDPDALVRTCAVAALLQLHTPEAQALVDVAIDDPAYIVREVVQKSRGLDPAKVTDEALLPAEAKVIGPQAVPVLIKLLNDPKASIRQAAALRLSQNPDDAAEQALLQALASHPDVFVRRAAVQSLFRNPPTPAVIALLREVVRHPDAELRENALQVACHAPAAEAIGIIAPLLNDPSANVRLTAATLLCAIPGPAADDAVIPHLSHIDWQIRQQALQRFARSPSPRAIDGLGKALAMPEASLRIEAIKVLALLPDPAVIPLVARVMADPDDELCGAALEIIRSRPDPACTDLLLKALASSPRVDIRLQAALRFQTHPTPAALEALGAAAKHEEDALRIAALKGLAKIDGAPATALIVEALADPIPEVRLTAATLLAARRDEGSEAAMLAALSSNGDIEIRRLAATRFQSIPSVKAVPTLAGAMKDIDDQLRLLCVQALQQSNEPATMDALIAALNDASGEVRQAALAALVPRTDPRAQLAVAAYRAKAAAMP